MTHLVYSGSRLPKGKATGKFRNPVHYVGPDKEATKVTVIGNYPRIVKDYQAAGVEVMVANDENAEITAAPSPKKAAEAPAAKDKTGATPNK